MPQRQRDDWIQQQLTEWGSATERMLCSSTLGYPKQAPLVALMEYGTSTFSGYRGSRTSEGIPLHLRRLDRLVCALPDGQRTIVELRYVADL